MAGHTVVPYLAVLEYGHSHRAQISTPQQAHAWQWLGQGAPGTKFKNSGTLQKSMLF
eukprot:SAG31_NODE_135_length_23206_cov_25.707967_15_plen_57_part_00